MIALYTFVEIYKSVEQLVSHYGGPVEKIIL